MIHEIENKKEWQRALDLIEVYDAYHTYDYHQLHLKKNEKAKLIVYQEGDILIALPLIIRTIDSTQYFDATSVYGYCGPISYGIPNKFNNLKYIKSLNSYFREKKIISVFSRLHPFLPNQHIILRNYGSQKNKGQIINIDLNSPVDIQRQSYNRRLKTYINKLRRNFNVEIADTSTELKKFTEIYHENMRRVGANKSYFFSEEYFNKIFNSEDFETEILFAVTKNDGEIAAASMFLRKNKITQYHLSGTKEKYLAFAPSKLLIDEMRLRASQKGSTFFNLGGGYNGSVTDSLFRFKSSFSKDIYDFHVWQLIVNEKVYRELSSKINSNLNFDFFPYYRINEVRR